LYKYGIIAKRLWFYTVKLFHLAATGGRQEKRPAQGCREEPGKQLGIRKRQFVHLAAAAVRVSREGESASVGISDTSGQENPNTGGCSPLICTLADLPICRFADLPICRFLC
jgi:hypothetical protein